MVVETDGEEDQGDEKENTVLEMISGAYTGLPSATLATQALLL